MSLDEEAEAYAEIFHALYRNKTLIDHIMDTCRKINEEIPWPDNLTIATSSAGMLNFWGWWYLCMKTAGDEGLGEGAKLIIEFLIQEWRVDDGQGGKRNRNDAQSNDYWRRLEGRDRDESIGRGQFRKKFQIFLINKGGANWWDRSYGAIAARGIGPSTNEGGP